MTDYENMSLDELKALKENREKAKLIEEMKANDAAIEEAKLKEHDEAVAKEALENYMREHPPAEKLPTVKPEKKTAENTNSNALDICSKYLKGLGVNRVSYDNGDWTESFYENADADSSCEDVITAWSPDDIYADTIWQAMHCTADLFRIAVKGLDISKGDGLTVQIRAISKRGAPSEKGSCECLSCVSNTFSTYSLTLKSYGDYAVLCDKDVWDAGERYMSAVIESMQMRWAEFFDATIYSEVESATPGYSETLGTALACTPGLSGSCCTDAALMDLYHALNDLAAEMREGNYKPDYIIVSPTVAGVLKRMHNSDVAPWAASEVVFSDGVLKKVSGIEVIEYCGANSCTDASGEAVAVMIDSRRAVGAAFGQRPKMYREFDIECNAHKITFWAYFACAELDTDAIGHVLNP